MGKTYDKIEKHRKRMFSVLFCLLLKSVKRAMGYVENKDFLNNKFLPSHIIMGIHIIIGIHTTKKA